MGCCQSNHLESEITILYTPTLPQFEFDEKFNEVPLSSSQSPLRFYLFQEDRNCTSDRLTDENTILSNIPHTKLSLELAFVCGKL